MARTDQKAACSSSAITRQERRVSHIHGHNNQAASRGAACVCNFRLGCRRFFAEFFGFRAGVGDRWVVVFRAEVRIRRPFLVAPAVPAVLEGVGNRFTAISAVPHGSLPTTYKARLLTFLLHLNTIHQLLFLNNQPRHVRLQIALAIAGDLIAGNRQALQSGKISHCR